MLFWGYTYPEISVNKHREMSLKEKGLSMICRRFHPLLSLSACLMCLLAACSGDGWNRDRVLFTKCQITQWCQIFRLHYELTHSEAKSFFDAAKPVIATGPDAVRDDAEIARRVKPLLVDQWGRDLVFHYERRGKSLWIVVASSGPDEHFGTDDDIVEETQVDRNVSRRIP